MQPLRRSGTTRRVVGVALLALLLAQSQMLVHAIAHAPGSVYGGTLAVADAADRKGHPNPAGHAGHDADGWGHPAGSPACDLFDALLGAQAPGLQAATAPPLPPSRDRVVLPARPARPGLARRPYQARGPPWA